MAQVTGEELDKLLAEVDQMTPEQIAEAAAKVQASREKRKAYNQGRSLTPEQKAERTAKHKAYNEKRKAREQAILTRAKELGINLEPASTVQQ